MMSGEPPAADVTIKRTGRVGYACAPATRERAGTAAAPAARCRNLRRGSFIAQPSQGMNGSLRLDVGRPDDLAPLLSLLSDESSKGGGRHRHCHVTEVRKVRLDLGIGESGVNLLIELVDDLGRRAFGCADPFPPARLVA